MCPMIFAGISTAISAASSIAGGMAAQNQAKAQQEAYKQQAHASLQAGQYEVDRKNEELGAIMGRQVAATNASGITLDGSPSDAIGSTASQGALDTSMIRWNARRQADQLNYQGQLAAIQGKNAMTGGILGAAGSIVGGLGQLWGDPNSVTKAGSNSFQSHHLGPF